MSSIVLRYLKHSDNATFYKALHSDWDDKFNFIHYWDTLVNKEFTKYIQIAPDFALGKHIPLNLVPCTFLFAFNLNGGIVGRVSIRHKLDEFLLKEEGYVEYGVVREFRRQAYASKILMESKKYIQDHSPELSRILLTCDDDNIGSRKTIEKNRGEFENIITASNGVIKRRYWINLGTY